MVIRVLIFGLRRLIWSHQRGVAEVFREFAAVNVVLTVVSRDKLVPDVTVV